MARPIEMGRKMLCKHCGEVHPLWASGSVCWEAYHYIWERDLLHMAHQYEGWRNIAHHLGFTDAKIDAPWTFKDEGRSIAYQRRKDGTFLCCKDCPCGSPESDRI
jgi:hypothetical protein